MRVNNDLPIQVAFSKATLGNEKQVQNIAAEAQISVSAVAKAETVAQTIAKLEIQLFQLFFENGPQLGQIVSQLRTLQAQTITYIPEATAPDSINQDTVAKLLDSLKNLFITPQEITTAPGADRIKQSLTRFFNELVTVKQNANPELQAKIAKFLNQIFESCPELRELTYLAKDSTTNSALPGQKFGQDPGLDVPQKNSEPRDVSGQQAKASAPVNDDNLNEVVSEKLVSAGRGVRQGQAIEITGHNLDDTPTKNPLEMQAPTSGSRLAFNKEIPMHLVQPDLSMTAQAEQTTVSEFKQLLQNPTSLQQKIQLLVDHFPGKGENPSTKLAELMGSLSSSFKDLQVDPVTQWDRLLRYPVIYKQALQKATKLLQEFLNLKQAVDPTLLHKLTDLLGEITANLHVQLAVNQLNQENPAKQQMYFQIPLQLGNEVKSGEMLVTHERRKRGNKWDLISSWYRFYLETQFIGPVDVSIHTLEKQLTIKLTVTTKEQALIFNQQRMSLRKILTDSGYDVVDIACGVGNVSPIYLVLKNIAQQRRVDVMV